MPRLSDSMEEGTIIKWLKVVGVEVARGDELVEIETDMATMTYEADSDGVLQIVAAEGDTLPVGEVIARLNGGASGDGASEDGASGVGRRASADAEPEPEPAPPAEPEPEPAPQANGGERVKASPIARRMASEKGLDLSPDTLPEQTLPRSRYLLRGLIWLGVGVAIRFGAHWSPAPLAGSGWIVVAVGVAYLIFYLVGGRSAREDSSSDSGQRP